MISQFFLFFWYNITKSFLGSFDISTSVVFFIEKGVKLAMSVLCIPALGMNLSHLVFSIKIIRNPCYFSHRNSNSVLIEHVWLCVGGKNKNKFWVGKRACYVMNHHLIRTILPFLISTRIGQDGLFPYFKGRIISIKSF